MASITITKDSLAEVSSTGAFVRTDSEFRATSLPSAEPDVVATRYHLYVSNACPWVSATLRAGRGRDRATAEPPSPTAPTPPPPPTLPPITHSAIPTPSHRKAHRALIVRKLKGLEGAVGLSVVHPTWGQTRPEKDEHRG